MSTDGDDEDVAIIAGMADAELDRANPRACPLLGLAAVREHRWDGHAPRGSLS